MTSNCVCSNDASQDSLWFLIQSLALCFSWELKELPKSWVRPLKCFWFLNGRPWESCFLDLLLPLPSLLRFPHLGSIALVDIKEDLAKLWFAEPKLLWTLWDDSLVLGIFWYNCDGEALLQASGVLTCFNHLLSLTLCIRLG